MLNCEGPLKIEIASKQVPGTTCKHFCPQKFFISKRNEVEGQIKKEIKKLKKFFDLFRTLKDFEHSLGSNTKKTNKFIKQTNV